MNSQSGHADDIHSSRTVNTKRNIRFGLLQAVVSQFLPFIVRTILIHRFGVEYLGLNSLFASLLSVLSLMELGFGTAVVYSMYKPVAGNDIDQICAYLAYFRKIYRIIGAAIMAAGLMLMPFLKYLIKDPAMPGGLNLYTCYLIFLGDAVISYLLYGYLTAIPTAYQRRDILSKVNIGISLLQCMVKSMLLLFSSNFYVYLISIPVITVMRNLIQASIIKRKYPQLGCRGSLSSDQKQDLNKKVYGLLINKITGISRNSIDTLCISSFIGLTVTGIYNNYYYIMTGVIAFSTTILSSMMASVGNSIATESRRKNYADMRMFDFMYMAAAGWAAGCLLCLYQPFIQAWLGKEMMLGMPAVIGLCAYFYILKSGDIRWVYHEGAGLWYESRYIMIGEAVVNTFLNIILCRTMQVFGIILATVISVFITNHLLCPRLLFKLYFQQKNKQREYHSDHAQYALTTLLTAGTSWIACEILFPQAMTAAGGAGGAGIIKSAACLAGRLLVCTALYVDIYWAIWHNSERYKRVVNWIKYQLSYRKCS